MKFKNKILILTFVFALFQIGVASAAGYETLDKPSVSYEKKLLRTELMYNTYEAEVYSEIELSNYKYGYYVLKDIERYYKNGEPYGNYTTVSSKIMDADGNEINIGEYDWIESKIDDFGGVSVAKKNENPANSWEHYLYGYVSLTDGIVIPCEYSEKIEREDENIFKVNWNYIDKGGNLVFDSIKYMEEGRFVNYIGNNIFEINKINWGSSGWVPETNEYINDIDSVEISYVDINGNPIEDIQSVIPGYVSMYSDEYVSDSVDTLIYSKEYGSIYGDGVFYRAMVNGKYGIVDIDGNIIAPFEFDNMNQPENSMVWAEKDEKWNVLQLSSNEIKINVDGNAVETDQNPLIINGRTLAPLRAIFEALGATVDWDGETKTVTAKKGDTTVSLTIDSDIMIKNGEKYEMDAAPKIVNDRTLVPVRAIAEAFSCKVDWNGETSTVIITE